MQTLVPTAVRLNNLSGSAADLDDSPDSPDANWCSNRAAAPQWFLDMTDKTWAIPVSNTLDDVKPPDVETISGGDGHSGICTNWSGACVDQSTGEFYLPANGGHGGYSGNEIYMLRLQDASPVWARIWGPSTPYTVLTSNTDARNGSGALSNGAICASHTYNLPTCSPGRIWLPGLGSMWGATGWHSSACWSFDRAGEAWTYHGVGIASPDASDSYWKYTDSAACYDPVDDRIWSFAQYGIGDPADGVYSVNNASTDPTLQQWSLPNSDAITGEKLAVCCPDLRLVVIGISTGAVVTLDLTNPSAGFTTRTKSGTAWGYGFGAAYHQDARAIYSWHNLGTTIRKLTIPDPVSGTWAFSDISPAGGNAVTPTAGLSQGTFGRFNMIEDMGNGQPALVLVNTTTGSTYVYKVPAAGL